MLDNRYILRRLKKPFMSGLGGSANLTLKISPSGAPSDIRPKLEEKEAEILKLQKELQIVNEKLERFKERTRSIYARQQESDNKNRGETDSANNMINTLKEREQKLVSDMGELRLMFEKREREFRSMIEQKDKKIMELEQRLTAEKDIWRERYNKGLAKVARDQSAADDLLRKNEFFGTAEDVKVWTKNVLELKQRMEMLGKVMSDFSEKEKPDIIGSKREAD